MRGRSNQTVALAVGTALVVALVVLIGERGNVESGSARVGSPIPALSPAPEAEDRAARAKRGPSIRANRGLGVNSRTSETVVPMPWRGEPQGTELVVEVGVGYCGGKRPRIDHVIVLERADRVITTVYVAFPPPRGARSSGCLGAELSLFERLDLSRPVGNRVLYDGVQSPPLERWRQ